jgi:hypothetical protein
MADSAYTSHQKYLEWYVNKTSGDIIEFGTGYGSTGFILNMIKNTNRKLLSLENDKTWLDKITSIYPPSEQHEYIYVEDWKKEIEKLDKNKYQIVFIDQSPWEARVWTMNYFKDTAEYVIIHDVDYYPLNRIFGKIVGYCKYDFSEQFKEYKVYSPKSAPPTLVGTNIEGIKLDDIDDI